MSSPLLPPPIYGVELPVIAPKYFPTIPGRYIRPGLSKQQRLELEKEKNERIDQAFEYLAALDTSKRAIKNNTTWVTNNSVLNLFSYLCCNKIAILKRAFCCYLDKEQSYAPVPTEASATLELTREQFDRNTLGVCLIAPAVIAATPFIPAGAAVATFLEIFSGLVITTTAGTNTYVFSGDIGVVPNGRGGLCVQGGIRVNAITLIENAYNQMAERLTERWNRAIKDENKIEQAKLGKLCHKICNNWEFMYEQIADVGLNSNAVEDVLEKFAKSLYLVSDGLQENKEINVDNLANSHLTVSPQDIEK